MSLKYFRHIKMYDDDITPFLETAVELKKRDHAVVSGDMTAAQIKERNAAIDKRVCRMKDLENSLYKPGPTPELSTKVHRCSTMKQRLEGWFKKLENKPQGITADMINDLNFEDWTLPPPAPDHDADELEDEKVVGDLLV